MGRQREFVGGDGGSWSDGRERRNRPNRPNPPERVEGADLERPNPNRPDRLERPELEEPPKRTGPQEPGPSLGTWTCEGDAEPLLEARDVTLQFGGISALRDVNVAVAPGELLSVIGPNGAGKTSFFNCVSGLYKPTRGEILFGGRSLQGLSPDRIARLGIARTFQNIELFGQMTTLQNLLLGRHLHTRSSLFAAAFALPSWWRDEVAQRHKVEEILDLLDLQSVRHQRVASLPYGMQKLVDVGRALALEPRLLMLDEPSAGMTEEEKDDLIFTIRDVQRELGLAVIFVEHDLRMVMEISERIIVLDRGSVIADGTPDVVQKERRVIEAYLGGEGMATAHGA